MPAILQATKESYSKILAWGDNNTNEWYHPVSRAQFAQGLSSLNPGDSVEFVLEGVSRSVEVVSICNIYEYPLLRHVNGDFQISSLYVERVIRVKLI